MNHKENNREDNQDVNKCACDMEDHECPNPHEEQNQRQGKKYKPHEQTPFYCLP
jgi:hypothetical protein